MQTINEFYKTLPGSDDAKQEAMIAVWQSGKLGFGYARAALKSRIINEWRKEKHLAAKHNLAKQQMAFSVEQQHEEPSELYNLIQELSHKLSTVLVLFYYKQLSVNEIAEQLGIPLNTVLSRLKRAKEALKEKLNA